MNSPFDTTAESDDRPTLGGAANGAPESGRGATVAVPPPLPPLSPDDASTVGSIGGEYETVIGRPAVAFDVPPPLPPPLPPPPLLSATGPAADTQDELEPLETPPFPAAAVGLSPGSAPSPFDEPATTSAPPFPSLYAAGGPFGESLPAGEAAAAASTVGPEAAFASGERQTLVRNSQGGNVPPASGRPFTGVAWLYFKGGSRKGLLHQFQKERTEVGRAADCDLRLEDDYASSHHAAFVYAEGEWFLYDFASTNGTSVNGRLLGREVPMPFELSDGDTVVIGDTEAVFKCII